MPTFQSAMAWVGDQLGANEFLGHSICLTNDRLMIWLFATTQLTIFASYMVIGLILLTKRAAGVRAMVGNQGTFGAFIFLCGISHLSKFTTLFWGVYRAEAVIMSLTAGISVLAAVRTLQEVGRAGRVK